MDITSEEKQLAIRISQEVEKHFEQNRGVTDLRSTDVYDMLVTKNLVERDRFRGFFFREFLKKLHHAGALGFIPQCRLEGKEWHFRPVGKRSLGTGKLRPKDAPPTEAIDESSLDKLKARIAQLPRTLNKKFTWLQLEKRKAYARAYEQWSDMELALLQEAVALKLSILELSRLFGRQPSVLEDRLNGTTGKRSTGYKRF